MAASILQSVGTLTVVAGATSPYPFGARAFEPSGLFALNLKDNVASTTHAGVIFRNGYDKRRRGA